MPSSKQTHTTPSPPADEMETTDSAKSPKAKKATRTPARHLTQEQSNRLRAKLKQKYHG